MAARNVRASRSPHLQRSTAQATPRTGGGTLDATAIYQLAVGAGFSAKRAVKIDRGNGPEYFTQAVVATAIALAESGGNPNAVNTSSGATGLWQIHPGGARYLDPKANARAAHRKYLTQGWRAWTTWTNGAYASHLQAAQNGATHTTFPGQGLDPGKVTPGIGPVGLDLWGKIGAYAKVAGGGAGLVITLGALVAVAGIDSRAGQAASQLVGSANPTVAAGLAAARRRNTGGAPERAAAAPRTPARPDVGAERLRAARARTAAAESLAARRAQEARRARYEAEATRRFTIQPERRRVGGAGVQRPTAKPIASRPAVSRRERTT